jgi:hypothetical protein
MRAMKGLPVVWAAVTRTVVLISQAAWGQEGASPAAELLTLEGAVALALDNNRPLKNAGLDVGKAADRIAAARTKRLPAF